MSEVAMKIEQKHVKHKTWHTKVTVGEGDDAQTFGLQQIHHSQWRVHTPFGGTTHQDFHSKDLALAFCQGNQ